jgi:ABC-type spermidine/putrescine transport system permease subunit I
VAGIVTVLSLVIAYPFAQLIAGAAGRAQMFLLWAVYMPLYVSVIMRAFGWTIILADSGLVNQLLLGAGIIRTPIRMLFELEGLTLGMLHRYLPLMIIPLVAALQKVDISLLKASSNLGASRALTWWRVTVPMSLPGIVAGIQLVFAGVLSDYALPALMGSTQFQLTAPAIYYEAVTNTSWALAGAMATLVLAVVALLLVSMNLMLKRFAPWASTL